MTVYSFLEESTHLSWVLQAAVLAGALLLVAAFAVRGRLANPAEGVLPDEGVTLRNVVEVLVEWLSGLAKDIMHDHWRAYFPLVGAMFLFILISNIMGLVPALGGATSDVNTAAAWAIISFVAYNYAGIKENGWKYVYQFMGPSMMELEVGGKTYHVRLLAPIMLALEVPLHFARMLTLTIRLIANMFADHTVVAVWLSLVPIAVPAIFMGLGLLIAFLQAFVFTLLTMIYIGMAVDEAH